MGMFDLDLLPREKAIKFGFSSLTDYELLAIIIRTGYKGENVIELSKRIIQTFNGIQYLKNTNLNDLVKIKGLKETKALNLLAVFEFAKRMNQTSVEFVNSAKEAFDVVYPLYDSLDQECFYCLILNARNAILAIRMITKGANNGLYIDSTDIIREVLKVNGKKIYLFHNHPSGSALPSKSDLVTTQEIFRKCLSFHIILLDHLVIANNDFVSMKQLEENLKNKSIKDY